MEQLLERLRLCWLSLASVVALAAGANVAAAAVPTAGAAPPGITTVQESSNGGVVSFTTYSDMATCEARYLTNCFEFTDGTVVGETDPLALVAEAGDLLPSSLAPGLNSARVSDLTRPCFTIPQMGSSDLVMDVHNGTTERLALSKGSCADLEASLARGGSVNDIIRPESETQITPLDPPSAADMATKITSECPEPGIPGCD